MMPTNDDRRGEIYELQTMLRLLSQTDALYPLINPDGIFGPETENAVFAFQVHAGLPPTGIVDFGTWTAITSAYRKASNLIRRGLAIFPFPGNGYILRKGEKSDLIYILQIMLSGIDVVHDIFENIDITGIYDEKTENAVRSFQHLSSLPETGMVDSETWDRIVNDYNLFANNPIYIG